MRIGQRMKDVFKRMPGFRKLVFFFNEVRRLEAELKENTDLVEYKIQQLKEAQGNLQAEMLEIIQKQPFEGTRLAIYTVLTGEYETLATPFVIERGCDYYCITNNRKLKSSFWKIIYVDNEEGLDNTRFQRKLKLTPHLLFPQYAHSLYIDAAVLIRGSVFSWIERNSAGKSLMTYRHPDRDCVYEEAKACKQLGKDSSELIDAQMQRYQHEGYPQNAGLVWTAIMYRKHHDPAVVSFNEVWLKEITHGSRRDQLSFNYACWKTGLEYDVCEEDYRISYLWADSHNGLYK